MTTNNITVSVGGTIYPTRRGSFRLGDKVDEVSRFGCTLRDDAGTAHFHKPQPVVVADSSGTIFTGEIATDEEDKVPAQSMIWHTIDTLDPTEKARKRTAEKQYTGQYAGIIVADMASRVLSAEGITANYAIDVDDTQSDFAAGTLSNVTATADGNLELSPAGSVVSYTDGTSPTLVSDAYTAIKFTGTAVSGFTNNSNNRMIWSGSITIASGDSLSLDCFLVGPEYKCSIGFRCTDGTFFTTSTGAGNDAQGVGPDAPNDLDGLANEKWYHRSFGVSGSLIGKTIQYFYLEMQGDKLGDYIAYFKNIVWNHSGGNTNIFNGATSVQTMGNLWNNGYDDHSVTVVNAYVDILQYVITHDISSANIVKSSVLSWVATTPGTSSVLLETSIDNQASWQPATNGAAVPNLLAGMSVASRSISYRISLMLGNDPTQAPQLNSINLIINPSYVATKSDVITSYTTATNFATGTLTNTRTVGSSSTPGITLNGYTRNYDDTNYSNQTLYTTGGNQFITNRQFILECFNGTDVRSRLDFAGQPQNFIARVSIQVHSSTSVSSAIVYRTTGWQNANNTYAYVAEVYNNSVSLGRGTNTSSGGGSFTSIATAAVSLATDSIHILEVEVNGNSHKVRLDGIEYINATDSTYTAAGYIGLRLRNSSGATVTRPFDNFGVVSALSGTWQSPSIDISGPGTYGNSMIEWDANSIPNGCEVSAQTSTNGGSTWQNTTNGSTIPSLTAGQSLASKTLLIKLTLTASSADVIPVVLGVTAWVMGQYSASGTRISPALSLTAAGRVGATLTAWNALTPVGTTLAIATSPTGTGSWTDRSNGDPIAGITGQSIPLFDTFDADSSANYTSTNRTGGSAGTWTYSTANSRVSVASGTNAAFLHTATSKKDVDVMLDLDQAEQAGLVWRWQDASNFYVLKVADASASSAANTAKLFKVVSNAETQLSSTATISFVRGIPQRIRIITIGTAITVSFNGESIISTTDSSITTAGKIGIFEGTGIGRFYNFRIVAYGDDLTGVSSYTRATLTSTDPLYTPQLQNLTQAALSPDIGVGALIADTLDYRDTYIDANMDDLSTRSNYHSTIRPDLSLSFNAREITPAPWPLVSSDSLLLLSGLKVSNKGDTYRNRQKLKGVIDPTTGETTYTVTRNNTGGFTGTVSQSQYAADEGGSGIVENVEDVSGQNMTVAQANAYGDQLLQLHGVIGRTINFTTRRTGLRVGQYLPVFLPEHNLNDASMLIVSIDIAAVIVWKDGNSTMEYRYGVEATEAVNTGSWAKLMASSLK